MEQASTGTNCMSDDQAVQQIYRILNDQGKQLADIQKTLKQLAVQDEQIRSLQEDIRQQGNKIDEINGPNGCLSQINTFQASCPRHQIKFLWMTVVPIGLTQIGLLLTALKIMTGV